MCSARVCTQPPILAHMRVLLLDGGAVSQAKRRTSLQCSVGAQGPARCVALNGVLAGMWLESMSGCGQCVQSASLLGQPQVSFFDYLVFTANCNFSASGAPHNYFKGVRKSRFLSNSAVCCNPNAFLTCVGVASARRCCYSGPSGLP